MLYLGCLQFFAFGPAVRGTGGSCLEGVVLQTSLLALLQRDFWEYAGLILDAAAKRSLEDACRAAGVPGPTRLPAAGNEPGAFTKLVEVGYAQRGHDFVRHAGYFGGANAGRAAEANVRSPNDGAKRIIDAFSAKCASINFEISQPSPSRFTVSLIALRPFGPALVAYAEGFAKGASMRLNEGTVPVIRERSAEGGKVWTATFDWGAPPQAEVSKGAGKTRHK
jgi:hypothetical protein